MMRNVKTFEISMMMILMMIFCSLTHFLYQIISLFKLYNYFSSLTIKYQVSFSHKNSAKGLLFTMFFSQKFGKRSAFTGSSTQNEHTDAKEDKFFKAQLSLTSKALVLGNCFLVCYYGKSRTVRCGAICSLTKAFKGTRIDAVI